MLGKRQRTSKSPSSIGRTTSMSELPEAEAAAKLGRQQQQRAVRSDSPYPTSAAAGWGWGAGGGGAAQWGVGGGGAGQWWGPRGAAAVEMASFLKACGICKKRLGPGMDTFVYRGEVAFCSEECRELHIENEERKKQCSLTAIQEAPPATGAAATGGSSDQSGNGETVAAA